MQKGKRKKVAGCKLRFCRETVLSRMRNLQPATLQRFLLPCFCIPLSGVGLSPSFLRGKTLRAAASARAGAGIAPLTHTSAASNQLTKKVEKNIPKHLTNGF